MHDISFSLSDPTMSGHTSYKCLCSSRNSLLLLVQMFKGGCYEKQCQLPEIDIEAKLVRFYAINHLTL